MRIELHRIVGPTVYCVGTRSKVSVKKKLSFDWLSISFAIAAFMSPIRTFKTITHYHNYIAVIIVDNFVNGNIKMW